MSRGRAGSLGVRSGEAVSRVTPSTEFLEVQWGYRHDPATQTTCDAAMNGHFRIEVSEGRQRLRFIAEGTAPGDWPEAWERIDHR